MSKLKKTDYDDTLVRNFMIEMFYKTFGLKFISNPNIYKIDLIGEDDPDLGSELEHGKWSGDYWKDSTYCEKTKLGYPTLNIPYRKWAHWSQLDEHGRINNRYLKNIFARTNKDFTQVIIVRSEVIRDRNKLKSTKFKPSNSNILEDWMCFKKEDVETYDLINKIFVLRNNDGV
jgi:hypothetical protein